MMSGRQLSPSLPKVFSISLKSAKSKATPQPFPPSSASKRHHSSLRDSDDEDDTSFAQPQAVYAFDQAAGGALSNGASQTKAPLVIAGQKNRDWREESRRKKSKNLLPRDVQQAALEAQKAAQGGNSDIINGEPQVYGLTLTTKTSKYEAILPREDPTAAATSLQNKTDDDIALEALLSNGASTKSTLVLPALPDPSPDTIVPQGGRATAALSETAAFKLDIASRPDSASLEQYAAVPVEEFGAALLRGMGWTEGSAVGKRRDQVNSKPRVVARRPAFLGIGAKEMPGASEELGSWGPGASAAAKIKAKNRATAKIYNPVLLKNKDTGELLTEEELKRKIELTSAVVPPSQERERRDQRERVRSVDGERKERRRDRDWGRDRDRDRDRDRGRDKDRGRDSGHDSHRSSRHRR
ncbi:MAG: hypothetical protein M1829_000836 [Trizodia sp. TS-e1964]|nr:MAG: hypothetical protein M1829_000836 [Trizodia sp. TS-e1964]